MMLNGCCPLVAILLMLAACPSLLAVENERKFPDDLLAILNDAETFELLSISPDRPKEKPADHFHGWQVLGKTTVRIVSTRKSLLNALKKGVEEHEGPAAACFEPRHGIRATKGGKSTDFIICFECDQVHVYVGDKQLEEIRTTNSPQTTFDDVLIKAKVPVPEKPKK